MSSTTPTAPAGADARARRPGALRWVLALALTAHAAAAAAQPVLIGGYLEGAFDLLSAHSINGSLLPGSAFLALVASAVYWAAAGRGWPVVALAVLWVAESVQMVLGHVRALWLHVPLGVLVVGVAVLLAVWAWTPAAGRGRQGWWR